VGSIVVAIGVIGFAGFELASLGSEESSDVRLKDARLESKF
jgi:hypothetical protein